MEYSIRLHPRVVCQIAGWGLSDEMLVEVYLKLWEDLGGSPQNRLHRDANGPGSFYVFDARDPQHPGFQLVFPFRVYFDEDEQHLNIVHVSYWRNFDPPD